MAANIPLINEKIENFGMTHLFDIKNVLVLNNVELIWAIFFFSLPKLRYDNKLNWWTKIAYIYQKRSVEIKMEIKDIVLLEFTIILRINSQRIQLANAFNSVFFFVARQLVQFLSSILNHTYVRPLHIQRHQIS